MSNHHFSRRAFVQTTSSAIAGTVLTTRGLLAQRLPSNVGTSPLPAAAFLPEPMAPLDLRHLATSAIDAATRAGASYADVRIAERHELFLLDDRAHVHMISTLTYGIRALVDGAWAFVHGSLPDMDGITRSARDAVAMAKGYAPLVVRRVELAPAPAVTGEWATPITEDPFMVPLRDQVALLMTFSNAINRIRPRQYPYWGKSGRPLQWMKELRVVATSEGTLTSQRLYEAIPVFGAVAKVDDALGALVLRYPALHARAGGFELISDAVAHEEAFLARAELAQRLLMLPKRTMDVGRYPLVVDGSVAGMLFGGTVGQGLELDRVLGEEADASGTSYLVPPLQLLGTQLFNPKLSVTASRSAPMLGATRWDDEGVVAHEYPVITNGTLVDYHTSRSTAPALASWYAKQRQPVRSHGCTVAATANEPVTVRTPHLRIAPRATLANLDVLCHEVKDGVLVLGVPDYHTDQQFTSCNLNASERVWVGVFLKVENGKLVGRVRGNGFDINTRKFWKEQLVALGDASTVEVTDIEAQKGMPWRTRRQSIEAPAALFKDVNVTAYRRLD